MDDIERDIRHRVEEFVADISDLIRKAALAQVSEALGGKKRGLPHRAASTKRLRGASRSGGKRSPEQLETQARAIAALIRKSPGIRADQMASALGLSTREIALPIKKLLADRAAHKKGQKRATQYYPGPGK